MAFSSCLFSFSSSKVKPLCLIGKLLWYSRVMSSGPILNCLATSRMTSKSVLFEGNFFSKILSTSSPQVTLLQTFSSVVEVGTCELWARRLPTPKYSVLSMSSSISSSVPRTETSWDLPQSNSLKRWSICCTTLCMNSIRQISPSSLKSSPRLVQTSTSNSQAPLRMPSLSELKIRYLMVSSPLNSAGLSTVALVAMTSVYYFLMGLMCFQLRRRNTHFMQQNWKSLRAVRSASSFRRPSSSLSLVKSSISSKISGKSTPSRSISLENPLLLESFLYFLRTTLMKETRSSLFLRKDLKRGKLFWMKLRSSMTTRASLCWQQLSILVSVMFQNSDLSMISLFSEGSARNWEATWVQALRRSSTSLQMICFSKTQAQHSTARLRVRQDSNLLQFWVIIISTMASIFPSCVSVEYLLSPSMKQKNSSSQNSTPLMVLNISSMDSTWWQSTRKGSMSLNMAFLRSWSAFSRIQKNFWNFSRSMSPRLTRSLKVSSLALMRLAWQWSSKMASKKWWRTTQSEQQTSLRQMVLRQKISQLYLLRILQPTSFFSIDGSFSMLMPSSGPSSCTRRFTSSFLQHRSSLVRQSMISSRLSLVALAMASLVGLLKSFSRDSTWPTQSSRILSLCRQSSMQYSSRRYWPITTSFISPSFSSNLHRFSMMVSTQELKNSVLKLLSFVHAHPGFSRTGTGTAGAAAGQSGMKKGQSLERNSRIISPQPTGWQRQQQAEQKCEMAMRRVCRRAVERGSSCAGLSLCLSRKPSTALTVSRSSSQTSWWRAGVSGRGERRRCWARRWRAAAVCSLKPSPRPSEESRLCSLRNLLFMDSLGSLIEIGLQLKRFQKELIHFIASRPTPTPAASAFPPSARGDLGKNGKNSAKQHKIVINPYSWTYRCTILTLLPAWAPPLPPQIQIRHCLQTAWFSVSIVLYSMQSQPESLNTSLNHIHSAAQTRFTQPLSPSPSPSPSQNYVPFLIKSNRFHHPRTQPAVPPIGSYDLPSCFDRKKSPFEDRASHFLLEAVRKKQQMCIFKSSLTRFNNISSPVPGPASYNLFRKDSQHRPPKPKIQQQRENLVELLRSCPSIPHKGNKYGYAVVNGNMRNIEKTEEQLEKERESRRHYVSTLQREPSCAHHDTLHRNYHDADYRKRLYEETQKVVNKQASYTEEERDPVQRKPKYEHLYHSKGVPVENSHKLLGPGQYDIARKVFSPSSRREKYQFFGSTEVRFKERTNQEEKGYTLIEMIKENNRKSTGDMLRDRKTPLKKKLHVPVKEEAKKLSNPGPGDYNPQDEVSKRTRGTAFFPQEERFKEKSAEQPVEMCDEELLKLSRTQSKKMPSSGNLKKDRFKPIHKAYDPVKSEQICGILSEKGEDCEKENQKGSRKREARARAENQEISCWSRGERREKARAGGYIKELKEELAIINYTPGPEEIIKKHSSNKYTLQSECTD